MKSIKMNRINAIFMLIFALLNVSLCAFSQNVTNKEKRDTIKLKSINEGKTDLLRSPGRLDSIHSFGNSTSIVLSTPTDYVPMADKSNIYQPLKVPQLYDKNIFQDARLSQFTISSFKYAPYFTWKNGYVGTAGNIQSMRGLMDMGTGSVFLNQNFGILNVSAFGIANKYALPFYKVYTNQFGYGGMINVNLNENISLNAFGTYYATMPVMPATAASFSGSTNFGGFLDLGINKKVGVDLGARHYFNTFTGHWVTDPIVRPYFKLNGKDKLGIDFGGLLKSFIWGKDQYENDGPMPMKARPMQMMRPRR